MSIRIPLIFDPGLLKNLMVTVQVICVPNEHPINIEFLHCITTEHLSNKMLIQNLQNVATDYMMWPRNIPGNHQCYTGLVVACYHQHVHCVQCGQDKELCRSTWSNFNFIFACYNRRQWSYFNKNNAPSDTMWIEIIIIYYQTQTLLIIS